MLLRELLRGLLINTSLIVAATWLASNLIGYPANDGRRTPTRLCSILLSAGLGLALMQFPVALTGGVYLGLRNVPIVLAALSGGYADGMPVAAVIAAYRYFLGGNGAVPGVITAIASGVLGGFLRVGMEGFRQTRRVLWRAALVFAVSSMTLLMIPGDGPAIFRASWLPIVMFDLAATALAAVILRRRLDELQHEIDIRRLAETDHLTGLYNARSLDQVLSTRQDAAQDCLLLLDLDHFKRVNDTYGHAVGDEVLRKCALTMKRAVRARDWVFRYGGEEFVVLLQGCELPTGRAVADRLREAVSEVAFPVRPGTEAHVTVSGGLIQLRPNVAARAELDRADVLLYRAKQSGRNRICWEGEPDGEKAAGD